MSRRRKNKRPPAKDIQLNRKFLVRFAAGGSIGLHNPPVPRGAFGAPRKKSGKRLAFWVLCPLSLPRYFLRIRRHRDTLSANSQEVPRLSGICLILRLFAPTAIRESAEPLRPETLRDRIAVTAFFCRRANGIWRRRARHAAPRTPTLPTRRPKPKLPATGRVSACGNRSCRPFRNRAVCVPGRPA